MFGHPEFDECPRVFGDLMQPKDTHPCIYSVSALSPLGCRSSIATSSQLLTLVHSMREPEVVVGGG